MNHCLFSWVLCALPFLFFSSMIDANADTLLFVLSAKDGNRKMEMTFLDDGTVRVDKYAPDSEFETRILSNLELDVERREDGLYLLRYVHLAFPDEDDCSGYPVNPYACCSGDEFAFFKDNKKIPLLDVVGHRGLRVTMMMRDWSPRMTKQLHDSDWYIWMCPSNSLNENAVMVNCRFKYKHTNNGKISMSPIRSEWGDGYRISQQQLFKIDFNNSCRISTDMLCSPDICICSSTNDIVAHVLQLDGSTAFDFALPMRDGIEPQAEDKYAKYSLFLSFKIWELKEENNEMYALTRDIVVRWPADTIQSILNSKEACAE